MKAFVIYLPERPHSVSFANNMLDTLKSYNLDAQLWPGMPGDKGVAKANKNGKILYPYSIKTEIVSIEDIKEFIVPEKYEQFAREYHLNIIKRLPAITEAGKNSMPGVVGCFYSHWLLWKHCAEIDEPIMIFEDDVKFFRGWEPIDWDDVLVLSLGKSSFLKDPWKTFLENPTGNPQPYQWTNYSMPGASGYALKPHAAKKLYKFYKPYWYPADNAINQTICKIQIHNYLMGRNTLPEEGNVSMTRSKDWL
jgi:GR25 family glycosyltransferase involved in LPS biosynthesis